MEGAPIYSQGFGCMGAVSLVRIEGPDDVLSDGVAEFHWKAPLPAAHEITFSISLRHSGHVTFIAFPLFAGRCKSLA
jgi:hypothetical protein